MSGVDPCARWAEIADRRAVGEDVVGADAVFLLRHAATCAVCGEEARVYASLEGLLEPSLVAGSIGGTPEPAAIPARRRLTARAAALTAGALAALAAAAAVLLHAQGQHVAPPPEHAASPLAAATATVTLLEGEATVDGTRPAAGATLSDGATISTGAGRTCVRLDPGVRVCLAEATRVRVENLEGPARVLRLERGRLAAELEPQPPGTTFSVAASEGSVTAIGTAFSVELSEGTRPVARVMHGVVLVREPSQERRLHAHEAARFGEPDVTRDLPTQEEDADRALLRDGIATSSDRSARLTLDSAPAGAPVRIDGAFVGTTPLDLLVRPGSHVVAVQGATGAESLELHAGEHVARGWAVATTASTPPVSLTAKPAPKAIDAESLLATARAARARGDTAAAARAYRTLLATHAGSAEAHAATLSLADLELARGAADEALRLFERYLTRGGPMALEARYGRIRALERLGRMNEAQAATASFLRDYAGSPQADALRAHAP